VITNVILIIDYTCNPICQLLFLSHSQKDLRNNLMKLLITMLICSVISACASTQIHLYRRYLSDQETISISAAIEQQGFDVITNTLAFPDEIQQSTLLYSPFIEKEDGVNVLLSSLESLGWEIPTVQALFTGNHFYTKDSAGYTK